MQVDRRSCLAWRGSQLSGFMGYEFGNASTPSVSGGWLCARRPERPTAIDMLFSDELYSKENGSCGCHSIENLLVLSCPLLIRLCIHNAFVGCV